MLRVRLAGVFQHMNPSTLDLLIVDSQSISTNWMMPRRGRGFERYVMYMVLGMARAVRLLRSQAYASNLPGRRSGTFAVGLIRIRVRWLRVVFLSLLPSVDATLVVLLGNF